MKSGIAPHARIRTAGRAHSGTQRDGSIGCRVNGGNSTIPAARIAASARGVRQRTDPVLPVDPQVEGAPEEDGQRGEQRRRVGDELRVGEGEEEEDEGPSKRGTADPPPAGRPPPHPARRERRGARTPARKKPRDHDGEKEPERLVPMVHLRREAQEMFPHEEEQRKSGFARCTRRTHGKAIARNRASPGSEIAFLPPGDAVTAASRARGSPREDDPDQPLREERESGASVREEQYLRLCRFPDR